MLDLAGRTGARVHVLHLSSAAALPALTAARRRGIRVTAETCPHYLSFAAADIPDGATQFKCCPPIRDAANRDALWQGLRAGEIDCVVSDHSPCTADLKHPDTGDFAAAWGGIASLQLGLPAVWTAARSRGVPLTDVVTWMAARPAALAGLARKGALAPGRDADLCVFAPDDSFVVDAGAPWTTATRCPPTHGQRLTGVVRRTWLRGVPDHRRPVRPPAQQGGIMTQRAVKQQWPDLAAPGPRRQRRLRQRRAVRRAGEPDQAGRPGVPAAHLRPQGPDHGRLGDPAAARARPRPRHRPARLWRGWSAGWWSTPLLHRQLSARGVGGGVRRRGLPGGPLSWPWPSGSRWSRAAPVQGDHRNEFGVTVEQRFTHVRLTIYPDGGVARLRIFGEPVPDPRLLPAVIDLAALENGALVTDCQQQLLQLGHQPDLPPGLARVMGDGWETSRRRDDGHDWVAVQLACAGTVEVVELDTSCFVGNAPGWASLRGDRGDLVPRTALQPDTRHRFAVPGAPVAEQVRLDVYPDGGLARLRVWGAPTPAAWESLASRFLHVLPRAQFAAVLRDAGLPAAEADQRAAGGPSLAGLPPSLRTQFRITAH